MKKGNERIERFNRTHKLQKFKEGEKILLKTNPVRKRSDKTAKKFFRLYDGPFTLQRQIGQTFIVYDNIRLKEVGKYHASSLRKFYE